MNLPEYLGAFMHILKPKCYIFSLFWSKLIPLIAKFMEIVQNDLLPEYAKYWGKKVELMLICIPLFEYLGSLSVSQSLNLVFFGFQKTKSSILWSQWP